jgi:hypothetical protein
LIENAEDYDYDVVVDTLQKKYDVLWKMTQSNMNSEFTMMNIMDDIRLNQMDELEQAIDMWKSRK